MSVDPRQHLPLKPVDLQVLLALADEERHGYGLVQEIDARTEGLMRLEAANLYRVLKRLLGDGLVAESDRRQPADLHDERRRYYALTPLGARVLSAELRRLHALVGSAAARAVTRRWAV